MTGLWLSGFPKIRRPTARRHAGRDFRRRRANLLGNRMLAVTAASSSEEKHP